MSVDTLPGRRPAGPLDKDGPGFEAAWQAAASAADARHENQAGMRNGRRFRIRALRSMPFRGSGLLRLQRRATRKLTTLRAGASSGRPAEGHRRRWRRVRARWPTRSSRAWQRSDGRNELGRRPHTAGRAASPARAAGALLPVRLLAPVTDLAAGLRGVPACRAPVVGSVFLRVPRGAILLPVMTGGAWRGNSDAYVGTFCGSAEESHFAAFPGLR